MRLGWGCGRGDGGGGGAEVDEWVVGKPFIKKIGVKEREGV